ncbi:hypothetical protein MTY66_16900 [Mycolicibacterium sp. TY66]|uniref:phosphodiesterase n=1 Tax=Mycobacteriaceae TaxID=1762 RepID=UPI001BB3A3AC|nr:MULTISPECIES: phosphodiesterase [unclassified Mycolicibacterium]BCI80065.1 hypothetical protein MTY66_16900 [Mycolicibacterium sp. TY66]BCJ82271.1 hypothetical protein MTY81_36440 [Mycolicibacterium sp. TY81]
MLETVTAPFQWVAAARHRRVFHPGGVLARGSIERVAARDVGLPIESASDVLVRLSKGIGTPGALPDVIGLAFRLPAGDSETAAAAPPWDVLLASAGRGRLSRFGVRPVVRWPGQPMSSVMPLRYQGTNWWLRAQILSHVDGAGVSLDSIRSALHDGPMTVAIDQAPGFASFRPLARLTIKDVVPHDEIADTDFDPVLHTAPGMQLAPHWLSNLRMQAYRRSRKGRHPDSA